MTPQEAIKVLRDNLVCITCKEDTLKEVLNALIEAVESNHISLPDPTISKREPEYPSDADIDDEAYEANQERDETGRYIWKYAYDDDQAEAFKTGAKWMLNKWKESNNNNK